MARVDLENISKVFPGPVEAVRGVSLAVDEGELLVLLGPSGCGKTTTLRLVAGLEQPTAGEIRIGGRVVNGLAPSQRDVAMVFQGDALYPHLTVERNLGFGVRLREGVSRSREWLWRVFRPARAEELAQRREEIDQEVRDTADLLGLAELLGRLPRQLSGGQRQRVAVGRAMVRRPAVFLFDEPLSNLDAALRTETRRELKRLHRQWNRAAIYVTHDQAEALTLGDRVAVMVEAEIQQVGTPEQIYQRPKNRFVAGFVGTPPMNLIEGELKELEGKLAFQAGAWSVPIPLARFPELSQQKDGRVELGIRPEAIRRRDAIESVAGAGNLAAKVVMVEHLGDAIVSHLEFEPAGRDGSRVCVAAKWPATGKVAVGDSLKVAIDSDDVYLFDAASGGNLGLPENA